MRSRAAWKNTAGTLALIVAAALASPGVRAVRADEQAARDAARTEGPMCRAGEPPAAAYDANTIARMIARQRAALPADQRQEIVVLNGRGYNYPQGRAPQGPRRPQPSR